MSANLCTVSVPRKATGDPSKNFWYQQKQYLLLGFLVFHVIFSLFAVAPGHLVGDERLHHMMVDSIARTGSLSVWNGYEEFPSPELGLLVGAPRDGKLMPWYPHLFSFVVAPFYLLLGFRGLFLLNAFAFLAIIWFSHRLTIRLFGDRELALDAILVLSLATYTWEYSQAAWPHMTSMLLVVLIVYLATIAAYSNNNRNSIASAVACGLLAGFGTGVRIEVIFVIPPIAIWLCFLKPVRWRQCLSILGATLPGLCLMVAINHLKFDAWSPFTYGDFRGSDSRFTTILPLIGLSLAAVTTVWALVKLPFNRLPGAPWVRALTAVLVMMLLIVMTPFGREQMIRLADGGYQLLVDLRIRDLKLEETGMLRGPGGSVVYPMYLLSLKKSLLQSCPYLTLLVIPLWRLRHPGEVAHLGLLFLISAAYVTFYSYFEWHGGLSLNLRYFLPFLPFTSILVAYALRRIGDTPSERWRLIYVATAGLVAGVVVTTTILTPLSIGGQEVVLLNIPLVMALLLLALSTVFLVSPDGMSGFARGLLGVCIVASLTWSGSVAFGYDSLRSYLVRKQRVEFIEQVAPIISPDSILFAMRYKLFFGLTGSDRKRLAVPEWDNFRDFQRLVDFHLSAGRPVYVFVDSEMAREIERRDLLRSLTSTVILEHRYGTLIQLNRQ